MLDDSRQEARDREIVTDSKLPAWLHRERSADTGTRLLDPPLHVALHRAQPCQRIIQPIALLRQHPVGRAGDERQ